VTDILTQAETAIYEALGAAAGSACVTCSFQAEDVVLVDLLRQVQPDIPVLFLDTGYHFQSVYEYRDNLARAWQLNLVNLLPAQSVPAQEAEFGILNRTDPAECCRRRKVVPLMDGLRGYKAWFTGLRREQSPTRANLAIHDIHRFADGTEIGKISPLAFWTWKDVWSYVKAREIPELPLYAEGYTSIGCEPCTSKPADPENLRSGRWGGTKLECGIHTAGAESRG
jgi:phosphoadenosine phosphosulfate reductase